MPYINNIENEDNITNIHNYKRSNLDSSIVSNSNQKLINIIINNNNIIYNNKNIIYKVNNINIIYIENNLIKKNRIHNILISFNTI